MPYHHLHQWSAVSDLWDPFAAVSASGAQPGTTAAQSTIHASAQAGPRNFITRNTGKHAHTGIR